MAAALKKKNAPIGRILFYVVAGGYDAVHMVTLVYVYIPTD